MKTKNANNLLSNFKKTIQLFQNSKVVKNVILVSLILLTLLLGYAFVKWQVVAKVDGKIITRWSIWKSMEKTYGNQALSDKVNSLIIQNALKRESVSLNQQEVDTALSKLDKQLESSQALSSSLLSRGKTKKDLQNEILTQMKIEKLLKEKATPTETDIKNEFELNKTTTYKEKKFDDVKESIYNKLYQQKFQEEFNGWFESEKSKFDVKLFGI